MDDAWLKAKWKILTGVGIAVVVAVLTAAAGVALEFSGMQKTIKQVQVNQKELKADTVRKVEKVEEEIKAMRKDLAEFQAKLARSLGRIEGKLDRVNGNNP